MKPLNGLQSFIQSNRHEPAAIRLYVEENGPELAEDFGVALDSMLSTVAGLSDDSLAGKLLAEIQRVKRLGTASRLAEKLRDAQTAADTVGQSAVWNNGSADIDLGALLEAATSSAEVFEFEGDGVWIQVPMAQLLEFRSVTSKAWRKDAWAFVDSRGLHLRWGKAGGLNIGAPALASRMVKGPVLSVKLPARFVEAAA